MLLGLHPAGLLGTGPLLHRPGRPLSHWAAACHTTGPLHNHQLAINREINELRMKIGNIKEELTHDMENLRKKNETEIQNKMEGQYSRLEQAEDRISEL
jgi:hypothetical protein